MISSDGHFNVDDFGAMDNFFMLLLVSSSWHVMLDPVEGAVAAAIGG